MNGEVMVRSGPDKKAKKDYEILIGPERDQKKVERVYILRTGHIRWASSSAFWPNVKRNFQGQCDPKRAIEFRYIDKSRLSLDVRIGFLMN